MSKPNYMMKNPELYSSMIETAYRIMDYIDRLKTIEDDKTNEPDRIAAAVREREFQEQDLANLKTLMLESKSGFIKVVFYKYIEGYTLEETAIKLNTNATHLKTQHAKFSSYLKNPKEEIKPKPRIDPQEKEAYLKALEILVTPEYETCCENCGRPTKIPHEVARKIFANESKRARVGARQATQS